MQLDWSKDSAAEYARRLGKPAALYAHELSLPVQEDEKTFIPQFLEQAGSAGADALITVNPRVPLAQVDAETAAALAQEMKVMAEGFSGPAVHPLRPRHECGLGGLGPEAG